MTPIEISEREVLAAAKAWHNADSYETAVRLHKAVALLKERERVAAGISSCIHGVAAGTGCAACDSLGGRAVDCPVKCPYCNGACKRGFEGHQKHRCAVNSSHVWGAEPIPRRPKKLSKRDQAVEARRKSDPLGSEREDIDYSSDELPSVR